MRKGIGLHRFALAGALVLPFSASGGLTYDDFKPHIEYRRGSNPDDLKCKLFLRSIEKVPDQIQRIIAEEGNYIVFFNGPLTDNPELVSLRGSIPDGWVGDKNTWSDSGGAYGSEYGIFLGIHGDYVTKHNPSLHEYGHAYNCSVGMHFVGKYLSETGYILDAIESEPLPNSYYNQPAEYVAETVRMFYESSGEKRILEYNFPKVFRVLSEIEEAVLSEIP